LQKTWSKLARKSPPLIRPRQHLRGDADAIKRRRDHGKDSLAEIGRSYNVSGWTIARLT
jgi:hypothetical protein